MKKNQQFCKCAYVWLDKLSYFVIFNVQSGSWGKKRIDGLIVALEIGKSDATDRIISRCRCWHVLKAVSQKWRGRRTVFTRHKPVKELGGGAMKQGYRLYMT